MPGRKLISKTSRRGATRGQLIHRWGPGQWDTTTSLVPGDFYDIKLMGPLFRSRVPVNQQGQTVDQRYGPNWWTIITDDAMTRVLTDVVEFVGTVQRTINGVVVDFIRVIMMAGTASGGLWQGAHAVGWHSPIMRTRIIPASIVKQMRAYHGPSNMNF